MYRRPKDWHPIHEASDRALEEGGYSMTALRCMECGRVLDPITTWRPSELRWVCPGYFGDGITEQDAAAYRLGPFATPARRDEEIVDFPGYVQVGPHTWERLGPSVPPPAASPVPAERPPFTVVYVGNPVTVAVLVILLFAICR